MIYKILSLDGGGTWCLIEVKALIDMYGGGATGHAVLSDFDLVVANSGGSIVLGGLLEDKSLGDILSYFMDDKLRSSIFQPTTIPIDAVLSGLLHFGPRYSAQKKLPALQRLLPNSGGKTVSTVAAGIPAAGGGKNVHVLITGFDYDRNVASFFRSAPTGTGPAGLQWGQGAASDDITLAQAIHASSNAPVEFFDAPAIAGVNRFWDGAISGCNNPVLAGVAEAITLGVAPKDIRAMTIGSATVRWAGPPVNDPPPLVAARSAGGFINDLVKLAGSITDDPPDVASFLAHVMTGGSDGLAAAGQSRVVRFNPIIGPVRDGSGGWLAPGNWTEEQLTHLAGVDLAALDPVDLDYIADYAALWISSNAPNQPLRMDADTLALKLGSALYRDARAAWDSVLRQ